MICEVGIDPRAARVRPPGGGEHDIPVSKWERLLAAKRDVSKICRAFPLDLMRFQNLTERPGVRRIVASCQPQPNAHLLGGHRANHHRGANPTK